MNANSSPVTPKRGGSKYAPFHLILLAASILLLTAAGLLFVYHQNLLAIAAMVLGLSLSFINARKS